MSVETRDQANNKTHAAGSDRLRRLDSWKEIAAFFDRDIRTVQLWERREQLPVHRHEHGSRSSVYAWPEELQQWLQQRKPPQPPASGLPETALEHKLDKQRILLMVAASLVLAAATVLGWRSWRLREMKSQTISAHTLAVLPFENFSSDPNQDYLSDGVTDELTSVIAAIPGLQVVARTSAFQFRHKAGDVRLIGQELNAAATISGRIFTIAASGMSDRLKIKLPVEWKTT